MSAATESAERAFLDDLHDLGVPLFYAAESGTGSGTEFTRPAGWQRLTADGNAERLAEFATAGAGAVCAVTGGRLAVVDVDPRNGGNVDLVRLALAELAVQVFAEVETPGGGAHFYVAGHPDLTTAHLPNGVDVQAGGANVFLPGTRRPKYHGRGYVVVTNNLGALADADDDDGTALLAWVESQRPASTTEKPAGAPHDAPAYADLTDEQRALCDEHAAALVTRALDDLRAARSWPEEYRDEQGRGWEKLSADRAQTLLGLLDAPWTNLGADEVRGAFLAAAPKAAGCDPATKWAEQEKRPSGRQAPVPPLGLGVAFGTVPEAVDFWQQRESLAAVNAFARARHAAPWAVLGVVLARVASTVPPRVVLPGLIGGPGSLNLFVALVGKSGGGKGTAMRTATDAVSLGCEIETRVAGSGEGLIKQFGHRKGGMLVRHREALLVDVPEVDSLSAMASRQASTLMPVMRSAWSGELLGFAYSDPSKDIDIAAHSYRLCAVVGVQPSQAGPLFAEEGGGTPQRFLWLPATDATLTHHRGEEPPVWTAAEVISQGWDEAPLGRIVLPVPEVARDEMIESHLARQRGEASALDGHAGLVQAKTMVALALLDGRRVPTEDDWHIAGQIMAVSNACRADIKAELREAAEGQAVSMGRMEGARAAVADDARHTASVKRVKDHLATKFSREWTPLGKVRKSLASRDRDLFDDALDLLIGGLDVEVAEEGGVKRGRLTR